jgi:hypothetical protein
LNIVHLENKLFILSEEVGVAAYDFNFELHFACDHPYRIEGEELCVLRIGPIPDYPTEFKDKLEMGLRLVNSPTEHALASELENWYPLIRDLTPRTRVFDTLPSAEEVEANFEWPVFMKGSRQTSKHNPDLSVVQNRSHYEQASQAYMNDTILHWQKPVIREFVPLMPVTGKVPGKVQPSVEYRSFWWHGKCVGWGRYWYQVKPYDCHDTEAGLAIAQQAATRLKVPFLVVDFAKTAEGRWIVIECNDAQESGYAGIPPQVLWRQVLLKAGD